MKEIEIQIGKKEYLPNGTTIESRIINPLALADSFSDTSNHEALHAVTAPTKVEFVSIIPGPGYLGVTKFSSFDAAAAAAPHAHRKSGTGWDTMLIEMSGGSIEGASAEAHSKLANKSRHIEVLSRYLEAKKTITGSEVRKVMKRVEEGEVVELTTTKPDGGVKKTIEKGIKGEIVIVDFVNTHQSDEFGIAT